MIDVFFFYDHIAYIYCFVASYLFLFFIRLVLIALFCAAIKRDSVFLLRFPFLSHVHIFFVGGGDVAYKSLKTSIELGFFSYCFLIIVVLLFLVLSVLFLGRKARRKTDYRSVFLRAFLCNLQVVVLIYHRCLQC